MNKYLGQGDIVFSATLAYFLTWTNALHLNTFGAREFFFILWAFLLNFVRGGPALGSHAHYQEAHLRATYRSLLSAETHDFGVAGHFVGLWPSDLRDG